MAAGPSAADPSFSSLFPFFFLFIPPFPLASTYLSIQTDHPKGKKRKQQTEGAAIVHLRTTTTTLWGRIMASSSSSSSGYLSCLMLVCYCWCYCGLIQPADCGNPDAKRLYDDLLSNYNKIVRPVVNNSDVLTVRIKLKLSQLIDLASVIFHPLHLFSFRHLSSHLIAAANSISYHFTNSLSIQLLNSWVGGGRRPGNQFSVTHF